MPTNFTSMLLDFLKSAWFWLLLLTFSLMGMFFGLLWRKKRKLNIPAIEFMDFGNGEAGVNTGWKAGWFGEKSYAKMLVTFGRKVIRLDNGDEILDLSTEDYQYVNNRKGVLFYRDPINKSVAVPINNVSFKNKELVAQIAPASYREHAIRIIKDSDKENGDKWEHIFEIIAIVVLVIGAFLVIAFVTNYASSSQSKAQELILQAGAQSAETCKNICKEAVNVVVNHGGSP
jgi:hypothetical protein